MKAIFQKNFYYKNTDSVLQNTPTKLQKKSGYWEAFFELLKVDHYAVHHTNLM